MNEQIARQLIKSRAAVRKKLQGLRSDITRMTFEREKNLAPITKPLKDLLSNMKPEIPQTPVKNEFKKELSFREKFPGRSSAPSEEVFVNDDDFSDAESEGEDQSISLHELSKHEDVFNEYLNQYTGLAREYIRDMIADNEKKFDHQYGIRLDPSTETYSVGNKIVKFDGDNIKIDDITYEGTRGLYELLFKKKPEKYTLDDETKYKAIMERSSAARKNYDPTYPLSGNAGKKYSLVKKILSKPDMTPLRFTKPIPPNKRTKSGAGAFLHLNNKKVEFVPWKNPNKLINRLRLLIAAQHAGNTSVDNDIIYIIEELKQSHIIK